MAAKSSKKAKKSTPKSIAKAKKPAKPLKTVKKSMVKSAKPVAKPATVAPVQVAEQPKQETTSTEAIPDRMLRVKVKKGLFFGAHHVGVILYQGEKMVSQTITDEKGLAFFMRLSPGTYKIVTEKPTHVEKEVKIEAEMTVCTLKV